MRSTQPPLQHPGLSPFGRGQTVPQVPQLFTSADVLTQVPPQSLRPPVHTQVPGPLLLHVWPLVHEPHAIVPPQPSDADPQFALPHACARVSGEHTHVPGPLEVLHEYCAAVQAPHEMVPPLPHPSAAKPQLFDPHA